MGVVVLRRYIDILTIINNFPYSTCISSFFGSSIFYNITLLKHSRSFKKSRSREYNYLIISIIKNVERASTAHARESRDFHVRGTE